MGYKLQCWGPALIEQGYVALSVESAEPLVQAMQSIASCLGGEVLPGRGGAVIETLKVLEKNEAQPRSLSRLSGSGAQPWHIDGSHLIVPPRYLILACESVSGTGAPPTQLMKIQDARMVLTESHSEAFVIRNGRSSFYSTITSPDRAWIRFDPGCMGARTAQGHKMLAALEASPTDPCLNMEWKAGDILVIDNWATLHRRGNATGNGHRTLLRISVKEQKNADSKTWCYTYDDPTCTFP